MTSLPALPIDDAFRAASDHSPHPTRLYVNLGERCNIRCVHCITDAPHKTKTGTAQVMGEDVVVALRPHLQHINYVGLTHAGEPMIQPGFHRFLDELRQQREARPTVVHLLSNGVALNPERFVHVVQRGVSSIAISLDGASASSNDIVRIGSTATTILDRLKQFVALRHEHQLNVRLGMSVVVTALNIDELAKLVVVVADAGLEWIKFEELFVDPDHLERQPLVASAQATARAIHDAKTQADKVGVVVVDHTRSLNAWRCQLSGSPSKAAFAAADNFANRTEINVCRQPYEQACIEPNGDVRPVSFHHPVAGNVLREDLMAIWQSEICVDVRRQQQRVRPCGVGPTTCNVDPGWSFW